MPSLIAKILSMPSREDEPWKIEDIADEVASGRLTIDATERVSLWNTSEDVSMAEAYLANFPKAITQRSCEIAPPCPMGAQELLLRLVDEGGLTKPEIRRVVGRAAAAGAEHAYLKLTRDWTPAQRLELALSDKNLTSTPAGSLPHAWAYLRVGLNRIARQLISDGWNVNSRTPNGQGLGHLVASPDIFPYMKEAGLDTEIIDNKGRTAPMFWASSGLTVAQQKNMIKAWANTFGHNKEAATETLLRRIGGKPKGALVSELKAAGLTAKSLVKGRSLLEYAIRDHMLDKSMPVQPAALRLLIEGAPNADQLLFPLRIALGKTYNSLSDKALQATMEAQDEKDKKLKGTKRLVAYDEAISAICEPLERHDAWKNSRHWALIGANSARIDEDSQGRLVSNSEWFRWMSEDEKGKPRVLNLAENMDASAVLMEDYLDRQHRATGKRIPTVGDPEEWLYRTFIAICMGAAFNGGSLKTGASSPTFAGELSCKKNHNSLYTFIEIWETGARPTLENAKTMLDMASEHQPLAVAAIETYILEHTTAPAISSRSKGMRL